MTAAGATHLGPAAGAGVRVLRARHVWVGPGRAFSPGEVRLDAAGRVTAVGKAPDNRVAPWLLVPGLVNAHVHLQLPALERAPRDFVPWLRAVIASRQQVGLDALARARTVEAIAELVRSGCTAVGEIDSLGTSPGLLARAGLAGRCYQEVVGYDLRPAAARAEAAARRRRGHDACRSGLSPHAPYSCSLALLRAARDATSHLTVHVGEDSAEIDLLRDGSGPLRTLLRDLGRWPGPNLPRRQTPVEWLRRGGALGPRTLLAHLQHASRADIERVRRSRAPVVVCPPTMEFFGRPAPDVPAWRDLGIRVALGTDSRASAREPLSMLAAMAQARRLWPGLAPETVLAMATTDAARAIGRPALGHLHPGARGDLCALALPRRSSLSEALDAATAGALSVCRVWLRGRVAYSSVAARRLSASRACAVAADGLASTGCA